MKLHLLLLLSLPLGALCADDPLPPSLAAARTRYTTDSDTLLTPVTESYAWELERAKRAANAQHDSAAIAAIDAELKRIGAQPSDPFPPQLQGIWSNNKTTPFEGQAFAISADGRAAWIGTMMGAAIRIRYFQEARLLRVTVLAPEGEELQGKPFATIEARLDADEKTFTVTSLKSIAKLGDMRNVRFFYAGAEIPEELKKLLK